MTKQARAIKLRDMALIVVKARGAWHKTKPGFPNLLAFRDDVLHIAYRSPFQKLPPPTGDLVCKSMAYGVKLPRSLPYGLDIWVRGKVLNIEWSDSEVEVVSYKAGSWEQALEALAALLG